MTDVHASTNRPLTVMVTGGTGFVGLHTVLALARAGHDVRLLVRSREKQHRVFAPFGLADLPSVEGDITDAASVEKALDGCDAVVHSAAIVSARASDSDRILRNNLLGTQNVLGGAFRRGIDRMVNVSSTTALFRRGAQRIDESSPLSTTSSGYGRSKVECERFVRELQDEGARIYTTYPGTVIGPDDPGLSEGMAGLKMLAEAGFLLETASGIQMVDVRDVALAHVRLLERGGEPDRYLMGGRFFTWPEYGDAMEAVTGRRFRRLYTPPSVFQAIGRFGEAVSRFAPMESPLSGETTIYASEWAPSDDSRLLTTLGFEYRDSHRSLYDSLFWLQGAGRMGTKFSLQWR